MILQEVECDEVFRKICYIEMVDIANNVTTEVCRKPLVKDCNIEGETICRTEYQSECWSKQIPHEVKKSQSQTRDERPPCQLLKETCSKFR